jgi:DNA-damage-inducible protein D
MASEDENQLGPSGGDLEQLPEIRRVFEDDTWYYNITDVIAALTGTSDSSDYRLKMKRRGKSEGFEETLKKVRKFPMKSRKDGKLRPAECVDRETLLRLVQSIPSTNQRVEDLKLWLAQVGEERLQQDEVSAQIEQVRQEYRTQGRDEAWINDRILNLTGRNALTDQWKKRGAVQTLHFGLLTTILHKGALGVTPSEHRDIKRLPKRENPREHMDRVELALLTLTEATSTSLHIENDSQGIEELKQDAQQAAKAGEIARAATEKALGRSVVSSTNFLNKPKREQKKQLPQPKQSSGKKQEEPDGPTQGSLF